MNIYLLRHGQTNFNIDGKYQGTIDKEINDFGRQQAELLGNRLRRYNIDVIYSSGLKRVVQTAEIINKYIKKDIIIKNELREINMGEWDCLRLEERFIKDEKYAKEWHKHLEDLPYPGGECGKDVCDRTNIIIDEIINTKNKNVAVVSSGGTILILLSKFLGLEQQNRFKMQIDNCSISIVKYDYDSKKISVKCINDIAHLEDLN